jgi:hypothetical protein
MSAPFQTSFQTYGTDTGPGILDAQITGLTVLDPTENEATLLLEEDDPFAVQVDWVLSGTGLCSLGGTWQVSLYIKDVDGQPGATSGQLGATVNIAVNGCQPNYSTTFNQPGNTVQPGVYQFIVAINHSPQNGPLTSLTENVGFAQSSPVKFTVTVAELN